MRKEAPMARILKSSFLRDAPGIRFVRWMEDFARYEAVSVGQDLN
jgi:hypothetical protein